MIWPPCIALLHSISARLRIGPRVNSVRWPHIQLVNIERLTTRPPVRTYEAQTVYARGKAWPASHSPQRSTVLVRYTKAFLTSLHGLMLQFQVRATIQCARSNLHQTDRFMAWCQSIRGGEIGGSLLACCGTFHARDEHNPQSRKVCLAGFQAWDNGSFKFNREHGPQSSCLRQGRGPERSRHSP